MPEAVYKHFDQIREIVVGGTPYHTGNHCACNGLAGVTHQKLEQQCFLWREIDLLPCPPDPPRDGIELDIGHPKQRLRRTEAASRQRPEPRNQLRKCERLNQVIVGATIESNDALVNRGS